MQSSMRSSFLPLLLLLLCSLSTITANAGIVSGLYEVAEAVPSRSDDDRDAAANRALKRVFVRVTGDETVANNPLLVSVLEQAQNYIQSYRYQLEADQLYLKFSFDPKAIDAQVHKLHLPLWPSERPNTLVWLAVDRLQQGRQALQQDEQPELFSLLNKQATARGLPVDFPLMDLSDQRSMPLAKLWAQDEAAAQRAAARYRPDANLMGRLLQTSSQRWQANWLLIHGDHSYSFDASGSTIEEVAKRGIDDAATYLARYYAVVTGKESAQSTVTLALSGVASFADYVTITRYFQELAQVSKAGVVKIDADRITVSLTTATQIDSLRKTLALNHKLQVQGGGTYLGPPGSSSQLGSTQNPLRYHWRNHQYIE